MLIGLVGCGDESAENSSRKGSKCGESYCEQPDNYCSGEIAVRYRAPGVCEKSTGACDLSTVTEREDCAEDGRVCEGGECVEDPREFCTPDRCTSNNECEGNYVVVYSGPGICMEASQQCDFEAVKSYINCSDTGQICDEGECRGEKADFCAGVTCGPPPPECDGNVKVTYTGNGVCVPGHGGCDFSQIEDRKDCAEDGQICRSGDCVDTGDNQCEDLPCEQPDDKCDGAVAVTYSGAGTCDADDGSCDYASVEHRVNCAQAGKRCDAGVCVDAGTDDRSVNPGDLVITEIMANPAAVDEARGEYFEVHNTTGRTLYLNGLKISDLGTDSFVVTHATAAPISVAPHAYFVFGKNADSASNGGVSVDYEWTGTTLANAADQIIITRDDGVTGAPVEINRVDYGQGTDMPAVPDGASLQFGAENDPVSADNSDGSLWCVSREKINPAASDSDLGTPGAANAICAVAPASLMIQDLQDPTRPAHPVEGALVRLNGAVVTARKGSAAWVQDPAAGPYSGVYVELGGLTSPVLVAGDTVNLEGRYTETDGVTTVVASALVVVATGQPPAPQPVHSDEFSDPDRAESWEGVLIRIVEPAVTSTTSVEPSQEDLSFEIDGRLRVGGQLFDYKAAGAAPSLCAAFPRISGVLHDSGGHYTLLPRAAADFPTATPVSASGDTAGITVTAGVFDAPIVCVDDGASVSWQTSDTASYRVVSRDPITNSADVTPDFDETFTAGQDYSVQFRGPQVVHYLEATTGTEGRVIILGPAPAP